MMTVWVRRIEGFVLRRVNIKEEFARQRDCFLGKLKTKIVDSRVGPIYYLKSIYFLRTTLGSVSVEAPILTTWKLDQVR